MFYSRTVYLENYAIWFSSYPDYSSSGSLILMLKAVLATSGICESSYFFKLIR